MSSQHSETDSEEKKQEQSSLKTISSDGTCIPDNSENESQAPGNFYKGSVAGNILRLALPMTLAQLINVLYSVVDRMYIGHIPDAAANALTGIGLTFPIISIITAFANLFGMGGAPLFSIERGKNHSEQAEKILGNTFTMLLLTGVVLTIVILLSKRVLLFLFGASDITFPYANDYLTIYLCGSVFVMISLGMNSFINAQGFGRIGMMTVLLGAVLNLILDPIFIFFLNMGVRGAALATVLSQLTSAIWAISFLCGKRASLKLRSHNLFPQWKLIRQIITLGTSGFIMAITNSGVQIVCNATLQFYGGDLYVGVMTIINSVREVVIAPINGLTSATQPVLGFNYGAHEFGRVRSGIRFMTIICVTYTTLVWICVLLFPELFIRIFNKDPNLVNAAIPSMQVYFFGFFMMSLQMSAQAVSVSLGKARQAIFFSLFRKAIIVIPLTIWLPQVLDMGVTGVFLAEPISNFIGGAACFITMFFTIWRELKRGERLMAQNQANMM